MVTNYVASDSKFNITHCISGRSGLHPMQYTASGTHCTPLL